MIKDELCACVHRVRCTDAWNKLGSFPDMVNCPCHNSSENLFFNIKSIGDAGYKSSVICLVGRKKLLPFRLNHCSVWSCRLCWGWIQKERDKKGQRLTLQKWWVGEKTQMYVLCAASALLCIQNKMCMRTLVSECVCVCVPVWTTPRKLCWFRWSVGYNGSESGEYTHWPRATGAVMKTDVRQTLLSQPSSLFFTANVRGWIDEC